MVDIEEWTGPGAKEWPNEHRPLQPGDNCVLVLMVMIFVMLMMLLIDGDNYCNVDDIEDGVLKMIASGGGRKLDLYPRHSYHEERTIEALVYNLCNVKHNVVLSSSLQKEHIWSN